jgi:hypothetical protein
VLVSRVTKREDEIQLSTARAGENIRRASIALSAASLRFTVSAGRPEPQTKTVDISNAGRGDLPWSVEADGDWLRRPRPAGSGRLSVTVTPRASSLEHRGVIRLFLIWPPILPPWFG